MTTKSTRLQALRSKRRQRSAVREFKQVRNEPEQHMPRLSVADRKFAVKLGIVDTSFEEHYGNPQAKRQAERDVQRAKRRQRRSYNSTSSAYQLSLKLGQRQPLHPVHQQALIDIKDGRPSTMSPALYRNLRAELKTVTKTSQPKDRYVPNYAAQPTVRIGAQQAGRVSHYQRVPKLGPKLTKREVEKLEKQGKRIWAKAIYYKKSEGIKSYDYHEILGWKTIIHYKQEF